MLKEEEILQILFYNPLINRAEIASLLSDTPSDSTMKRHIAELVSKGMVDSHGHGPATKYDLSAQSRVTMPLDIVSYFEKDMDERQVQKPLIFN